MNGWKKAAVVAGALALVDFLGGSITTMAAVAITGDEYMTPLENRLMSAAGVLMITLAVLAGVLFFVGDLKDDAAERRRD